MARFTPKIEIIFRDRMEEATKARAWQEVQRLWFWYHSYLEMTGSNEPVGHEIVFWWPFEVETVAPTEWSLSWSFEEKKEEVSTWLV